MQYLFYSLSFKKYDDLLLVSNLRKASLSCLQTEQISMHSIQQTFQLGVKNAYQITKRTS